MEIRTVTVELLRAGPRHNQLVSPLTQYLGVCGNAAAGRISLPYEHGELELRLQELRYRVTDQDDPARRSTLLDQTGQDVAQILSAIPGVSGVLNPEDEQPRTLTHLRIVLSASELAMLPFEASKVPTGDGHSTTWLALQARSPVCITRHIRSVSAEGIRWPSEPRILFIAGPDTDEPLPRHRDALIGAMKPWPDKDGDRLVVLEKATLDDVSRAIDEAAARGKPFTHVHILAHGAALHETDRYSPAGLALYNGDGSADEVISGGRLATALVAVTDRAVTRPVVVTLATCDSGRVSDVRTTEASVAHDLHDQGIPLVVASQFPLSVEGSVPFVERFYQRQLWGEHPLVSLYAVRLHLHSCIDPDTHDWASLVVYEAFPSDLADQLEEVRYWQARRAQEGALARVEALVRQDGGAPLGARPGKRDQLEAGIQNIEAMSARLPTEGPYGLECAGLRAAGHKRIAEATFRLAVAGGAGEGDSDTLLADCLNRLERARAEYWRAAKAFLGGSSEPVRRKATLHWLLGQVLSLDVVLGRPLNTAHLEAVHFAAKVDLDSPSEEERAWAHASLSECALLSLADPSIETAARPRHAEKSIDHAKCFLEMFGRASEQVVNSSRQFERYADWWGSPEFQKVLDKLGVLERPHWHGEHGIVPTAKRIVALLRGPHWPASHTNAGPTRADRAKTPSAPAAAAATATYLEMSAPKASRSPSTFAVEMLPADNGDCLWIEYGDPSKPRRVLIDCGALSAARTLASRIESLGAPSERVFELFVLTHIDADHINGVVPLFRNPDLNARFADIWFNGWGQVNRFLGVKQGEEFSKLLEERALPWNRAVTSQGERRPAPVVLPADKPPPTFDLADGLRLTLLSPGADQLKRLGRDWRKVLLELDPAKAMLGRKRRPPDVTDLHKFDLHALASKPAAKDPSVANGSSIALLAEFDGRAILLTGDAHADVLTKSIKALQRARGRENKKLKLDAIKLSHHGSANATTVELLELLDCPRYLVSSNGNLFYHPDREAMARVILHGGKNPGLYFNYRSALNELWDEPALKARYGYRTEYPEQRQAGLRVPL